MIIGENNMKSKQLFVILVSFSFLLTMFNMATPGKAESDFPEHCTAPDKQVVVGVQIGVTKFNVSTINVNKGECFTIVFQNLDSSMEHDLVIDEVGGGNHSVIDANHNGPNIDHVDFDSAGPTVNYGYGANGINKFNVQAPNVDATFQYYCDVAGHKEGGMYGSLIVGAGATGSSSNTPGFEIIPTMFAIFASVSIVIFAKKHNKN